MRFIEKFCESVRYGHYIHRLSIHVPILRKVLDLYERSINQNCIKKQANKIKKNGWSFVIITNGSNVETLYKSIQSILLEFADNDNFEVIVVGQNRNFVFKKNSHVKYIKYHSLSFLPGWITYKKNLGATFALYDKLCIMHDYIALCKGWLEGYSQIKSFDICTNKQIHTDGRRARDWVVFKSFSEMGMLPYAEYSDSLYINGAYFVARTSFFLENSFDEKRRWGELEDLEWSARIKKRTKILMNPLSCCCYLKEKPKDDPPYCDDWIDYTIKVYKSYGYSISKENFAADILLY